MHRKTIVALVAGAIALGACGDGDDGGSAEPDRDRYCELALQLDEGFDQAVEDAQGQEETFDALGDFVDENDDAIDEIREVAPAEITNEVDRVWTAREEAAETRDLGPIGEGSVERAERNVDAFDQENCDIAAGGG